MVLNVAHRHSTGASGLVIHTHPARPDDAGPWRYPGAAMWRRPGPGAPQVSKGPTSESTVLGVVPFLALLRAWEVGSPSFIAQVLAQAKRPGPFSRASLTRAASRPSAPVISRLADTRSARTSRPKPPANAAGQPHHAQ